MGWRLFWFIPVGHHSRYDCVLKANGFETLTFDVCRLFENPYDRYEDFPKAHVMFRGELLRELPVREISMTLRKAGAKE